MIVISVADNPSSSTMHQSMYGKTLRGQWDDSNFIVSEVFPCPSCQKNCLQRSAHIRKCVKFSTITLEVQKNVLPLCVSSWLHKACVNKLV